MRTIRITLQTYYVILPLHVISIPIGRILWLVLFVKFAVFLAGYKTAKFNTGHNIVISI